MPSKKAASRPAAAKTGPLPAAAKQPPAATHKAVQSSQQPPARLPSEPRRFTPASYTSRLRRTKAARSLARNKLPNSFKVFYRSVRMLTSHWEVFGGVLLIYAVINILLIGGFSNGTSLDQTKGAVSDVFTGRFSKLSTGLTLFGFLVQSGSSVASGVASAYQTIVLILVSLAFVWGLRQLYAGNKIRIRDTFYQSTHPLVPVLLVLLVICVQLVPAVVGGTLFVTLVINHVLQVLWQQILIGVVGGLLAVWTFYMLIASLFAVYIATLPEMTPLAALRSAREIVRHRRLMVLRRILFLPLALLVIAGVIMVPLSIVQTTVATVVFFVLTVVSVPVVHSYMYSLYRILIAE